MNEVIFIVKDRSNRNIRLTEKQWKHIIKEHPELITYFEEIKETLRNPNKIKIEFNNIAYYYKYIKNRKYYAKYLLAIVKYLNDHGFIITAYFVKNIR